MSLIWKKLVKLRLRAQPCTFLDGMHMASEADRPLSLYHVILPETSRTIKINAIGELKQIIDEWERCF